MKKRQRGRPPFPEGTAKNQFVAFKVSAEQLIELRAAAKVAGLNQAAYIRSKVFGNE